MSDRAVPWWALGSSAAAPVLLIGGWTIAQSRRAASVDPLRDSISALAALGATDRWIMTAALAAVGVCHMVTGLGLSTSASPGRAVLAVGGLATVLVAALPLPSGAHGVAAAVAFGALAVWPALSSGGARPSDVMPLVVTAVLVLLLGWFVVELAVDGRIGLAERCAAGAQALWPFVAVLRATRRGQRAIRRRASRARAASEGRAAPPRRSGGAP
ncbi:DUF998 domain-containing protein [Pseudonocardia spinosispora]|uniref:DUF998 domain-containing protein n=1 Tax=Pseudonocardia spinosispora TaxID=103441 RepID=UPI0006850FB5|nr:DUF998 domain-containing protein [Pseudonocardia spinosispora]